MPIVKIKLDLTLTSHEASELRERLNRLIRSGSRIPMTITNTMDPIVGWDGPIGLPYPGEYSIELHAFGDSQIEEATKLLMEFGTPLQKDKHRAASLLSRVAQEANGEAGFPISPTDTMQALEAACGNGGSTWHGLVRKKLHEWFRTNEV